MRAGAVQLNSTDDLDRNLATADRLVREAAAQRRGAGRAAGEVERARHRRADGRRGAAARRNLHRVGALGRAASSGSTCWPDRSSSGSPGTTKSANTSVHVGPDGEIRAVYRKIHMFDVEVDGVVYAESREEEPGAEVVVSELAGGARLGMSICYDVRFPELYRILAVRGRRGDRRAERLHAGHHTRPLGGAGPGSRDREPVLRGRRQPDRSASAGQPLGRSLADRRSVGAGARDRARRGDRDRRRPRLRQPARDPRRGSPCSSHRRDDAYAWSV